MDSCWTVPVTMGAAAFLVCMPWSWFGLLLVLFAEKYGITRETASWPKSIAIVLTQFSGLVVYALQRRIRTYYIVLLGTLLTCVAFISMAFASNIFWVTVTFGVFHGSAHGIFITSSAIYTMLHFEKYRAIATSFIFIAYGLSAVISQFVLAGLVETYGLQGAFLLYGAILMNSVTIVFLARNPSPFWCRRKRPMQDRPQNALSTQDTYEATGGNVSPQCSEESQCHRPAHAERPPESNSPTQILALFTTPSFYVLLAAMVAGDYTGTEFLATIVDYGMDKGMELDSAKHLVTFAAIGQLLGRIVIPVIADCMPATRRPLYACTFVVFGACMMTMPRATSTAAVVALATALGATQGYILCMRFVLLAEYLGIERTAASCGIIGTFTVPVSFISPFMIGYFRDETGSYDNYYWLLGIVSFSAGVLFAVHHICQKLCATGAQPQETVPQS